LISLACTQSCGWKGRLLRNNITELQYSFLSTEQKSIPLALVFRFGTGMLLCYPWRLGYFQVLALLDLRLPYAIDHRDSKFYQCLQTAWFLSLTPNRKFGQQYVWI
jgi:hypothetical protein